MSKAIPEDQFQNKKKAKKCPICAKEFSSFRWKYHCHLCGDVVCDDCSKTEVPLPPLYPNSVRVCDLCKNQAPPQPGQGRRLGGNEHASEGNEEEERQKRMNALAARQQQGQQRGVGTRQSSSVIGSGSNPQSSPQTQPTASTQGGGQQLGDSPQTGGSGEENPMLAAALRRQQSSTTGGPGAPKADPEKQQLVTQIQSLLHKLGDEEPFGLRSMEPVKLRVYLRHLEDKLASR